MMKNVPICVMIKIINNVFDQEINKVIAHLDLTSSQASILGYLAFNKDKVIFPKNIEEEYNLKHPTVTGILQRMEAKGFIQYLPVPSDHRYKQIRITQKSLDIHDNMDKLGKATEKTLLEGLTTEEVNTLDILLNKMVANIALK